MQGPGTLPIAVQPPMRSGILKKESCYVFISQCIFYGWWTLRLTEIMSYKKKRFSAFFFLFPACPRRAVPYETFHSELVILYHWLFSKTYSELDWIYSWATIQRQRSEFIWIFESIIHIWYIWYIYDPKKHHLI